MSWKCTEGNHFSIRAGCHVNKSLTKPNTLKIILGSSLTHRREQQMASGSVSALDEGGFRERWNQTGEQELGLLPVNFKHNPKSYPVAHKPPAALSPAKVLRLFQQSHNSSQQSHQQAWVKSLNKEFHHYTGSVQRKRKVPEPSRGACLVRLPTKTI